MAALIALLEDRLGMSYVEVVAWLRDQNSIEDIAARLATGRIDDVITGIQAAGLKLAEQSHDAYVTAGKTTAEWIDSKVTDKLIRFDVTNINAIARARANQLELVIGLSQEQRTSIRQVLIGGARSGANPLELARDIRDSIGLTPTQEAAVRSYREALASGDLTNALGRELSSGHSDRTIEAARARGALLTRAQEDTAVDRYRENFITSRAETIGRTEGSRVAHQGNWDAFKQAIGRGDIRAELLVREWLPSARTKYSRPDHQRMRGQQRGIDEPFETPSGIELMYPGDEDAPASETANCKCTVTTRFRS